MKAGGGKLKGGRFEREISKKLSLWISNNTTPNIFWRSASSGAKATQGFKKGLKDPSQAGDLCAVDTLGMSFINRFFIELKSYKNLHWESLIYNKPTQNSILEFWNKAKEQANQYNKIPILICRQNNKKDKMITNYSGYNYISDLWGNPIDYISLSFHELYLFDFDWFVDNCDPRLFY